MLLGLMPQERVGPFAATRAGLVALAQPSEA